MAQSQPILEVYVPIYGTYIQVGCNQGVSQERLSFAGQLKI
jgi:hypothetical protein